VSGRNAAKDGSPLDPLDGLLADRTERSRPSLCKPDQGQRSIPNGGLIVRCDAAREDDGDPLDVTGSAGMVDARRRHAGKLRPLGLVPLLLKTGEEPVNP
jgi:hypothetical protein